MEEIEILKKLAGKVKFKGVKEIGDFRLGKKVCRNFIGRFEASFPLPEGETLEDIIDKARKISSPDDVLRRIRRMDRVKDDKGIEKSFHYNFDITPKTICRSEFSEGKAVLYVAGYGMFS